MGVGGKRWSFDFAGQSRQKISCPICGFVPFAGIQWMCAPDGCGGSFDTFATRARCPHCDARFTTTECPGCHRWSAHEAWYN
jgi:ribosomal protein S27E